MKSSKPPALLGTTLMKGTTYAVVGTVSTASRPYLLGVRPADSGTARADADWLLALAQSKVGGRRRWLGGAYSCTRSACVCGRGCERVGMGSCMWSCCVLDVNAGAPIGQHGLPRVMWILSLACQLSGTVRYGHPMAAGCNSSAVLVWQLRTGKCWQAGREALGPRGVCRVRSRCTHSPLGAPILLKGAGQKGEYGCGWGFGGWQPLVNQELARMPAEPPCRACAGGCACRRMARFTPSRSGPCARRSCSSRL